MRRQGQGGRSRGVSKERQSNGVRNKEVRRGPKPSKRSRTHPWPACSSTRLSHFDRPIGWNKEPSDASLTNPETVKRRHPERGTGWPDQPACVVYTWPPPARYGSEGGCSRLTSSRIVSVTVHRRPLVSPASRRDNFSPDLTRCFHPRDAMTSDASRGRQGRTVCASRVGRRRMPSTLLYL